MQKFVIAFALVASTVAFTGCSRQMPAASTEVKTGSEVPSTTEKVGQTTKTGEIIQLDGKFYLQQPGQQPLGIDSYNVDLSANVGKTVTITGEYSGNTLFVGKLEE